MWTITLERTHPGGKLTSTRACVALFEAAGGCGGQKSLSSIKEEAVVGKTFWRNFAAWKSFFGKILDRLHWCEEVYVDASAVWGSSISSNDRHLLCSISSNSGCWWRPGTHGEETAIWHSRSVGSSLSSLQSQTESALFQVCWTSLIVVWVFFLSSSSRGLDKPLLMPAMSSGVTPTLLSDRRGKMKTKFVRNLIKMIQNIQSVEKKTKTSLLDRENKYWQSFGEGWFVNTPNLQPMFLCVDQLINQFSIQKLFIYAMVF